LQSGFLTADDILGTLFLSGYVLKFKIAEIVNPSVQCVATKGGHSTVEMRSEPNDRNIRRIVIARNPASACRQLKRSSVSPANLKA